MNAPYAEKLRPKTLDQVVGQEHLLAPGSVFRTVIDSGTVPNMIFFGPSGVGKTTVARIIAEQSGLSLHKLNGTSASTSDIKDIIKNVGTIGNLQGTLIYLDEIQYLNKKQQQSLLEYVENGSITLIASTTENPYFYVYNALLSRCTIFEFKTVSAEQVAIAVQRASDELSEELGVKIEWEDDCIDHIARTCGGDVRKAINAVELCVLGTKAIDGVKNITLTAVKEVSQRSAMRYDRDADVHYDLLSALQKSVRGSDPDAAVYYLARILEGGDLLSACRRLMVMAAEDVGLAYPQCIVIVKACVDVATSVGLPEAVLPLSQAAVLMATAPKSNSSSQAIWSASGQIKNGMIYDPPAHLRDSHYGGAEKLGRGIDYKYPHDFPNHYTSQQYLPDEIKDQVFYEYGGNKTEQAAKEYWDKVKRSKK